MAIFVSEELRDYIRRLMLEVDRRCKNDLSKGCETARVLEGATELEGLAKMRAGSRGIDFVHPDDVKAMAVYVVARRHADAVPERIVSEALNEVPLLV